MLLIRLLQSQVNTDGKQLMLYRFPTDAKLATLVNVKYEEGATSTTSREQLYIVTENKQVFTSQDGIQWEIVPKLGSDVQALVAGFPNTLTVITDNGVYSTSDNGESQNSGQFDDTNYHPTAISTPPTLKQTISCRL